ncbi:hypothetical protein [Paraburkholderia lycopersici]|uniref:hypothetical protein n=1 Tax=Paraburkholderia lycopersici TaxID=416944 RepID=UPI001C40B87E|nr:hypothetical protein [Paraburkholderia lycopersici]
MSTANAAGGGDLQFTPAVFSPDEGVLFSVYGLNLGYHAFTLSYEAACEQLGARHQTQQEMLLVFQLNHPRIARAIKQKTLPQNGCRVVLETADFVAQPKPPRAAEATSPSNDSGPSGLDAENE